MQPYTKEFYKEIMDGSRRSAREVIPFLKKFVNPKSVIDVGCGVGTWLSVFQEHGVEDILGIDGGYVDKKLLQIPVDKFISAELKKPLKIDRDFDLVMSLEVAEHLPKECAESFVNSLVRLGPVVLFAASIPFQGGTHHVNEQWPDYWNLLFKKERYLVVDAIRKLIWQNDNIEYWYRQNILLFIREDYLMANTMLKKERENTNEENLTLIHPEQYKIYCRPKPKQLFKIVPRIIINSLKNT